MILAGFLCVLVFITSAVGDDMRHGEYFRVILLPPLPLPPFLTYDAIVVKTWKVLDLQTRNWRKIFNLALGF